MKPLYLAFALCGSDELQAKAAQGRLAADDFLCLRVRFNDPEVSFFTMLAGVPHGEAVGPGPGDPATFYVTEPRDLTTELLDFHGCRLRVEQP